MAAAAGPASTWGDNAEMVLRRLVLGKAEEAAAMSSGPIGLLWLHLTMRKLTLRYLIFHGWQVRTEICCLQKPASSLTRPVAKRPAAAMDLEQNIFEERAAKFE